MDEISNTFAASLSPSPRIHVPTVLWATPLSTCPLLARLSAPLASSLAKRSLSARCLSSSLAPPNLPLRRLRVLLAVRAPRALDVVPPVAAAAVVEDAVAELDVVVDL